MSTSERSSYHHGDLRGALVAAARDLLIQGGAENLSLRAVARRAGVSAMAPYRHFRDKTALLAAVAESGFVELERRLHTADQAPVPADALRQQGIAYVRFACEQTALFRLMFGPAFERADMAPGLREAGAAAFDVMRRRVDSLVDSLHRQDLALVCWSLVHGLASLIIDRRIEGVAADDLGAAEAAARRLVRFIPVG